MSDKKEQVKPLAPAAHHIAVDERAALPVEFMSRRHQRCIKWGGCSFAILSIILTIMIVLTFTVFHIKNPILDINYAYIQLGLHNATIEANVSIKNPNVALFKFSNMTTNVWYDGAMIGETRALSGVVKARRTVRMNLPINVRADEMSEGGRARGDLLGISSYTRISGEVKISGLNKKSLVIRMNCTMNLNVSSQRILNQNCRRGWL